MKHIYNFDRSRFNDVAPECTFCYLSPPPNPIDMETYQHVYSECRFVKPLADEYFSNLTTINCDYIEILAVGCQIDSVLYYVFNIEVLLFCYYIFHCKKIKKLPTLTGFLQMTFYTKKVMFLNSKKYLLDYNHLSGKFGVGIKNYNKWLDFC